MSAFGVKQGHNCYSPISHDGFTIESMNRIHSEETGFGKIAIRMMKMNKKLDKLQHQIHSMALGYDN
jgi:hypothetical protein